MTGQAAVIYRPDAIDANRNGTLTDAQRRDFTLVDRGIRKDYLTFAAVAAVIGLLLVTATGPAPNAQWRPFVGIGAFVVAAVLVFLSLGNGDTLAGDLRGGRVETIEGAVAKDRQLTQSSSMSRSYYLIVAGKRFSVHGKLYDLAPDAGIVRLYYLPRSHQVVNMEQLPDRPVPQNALESPVDAMHAVAGQLRSHDMATRAEAMAEVAALEHAVHAQMAAAAIPPEAGERDPRPLSEAIVGTWRRGPMALTFGADGTVSAGPHGKEQSGHWKVDDQGRLHADALGHDQAAEAWVAGNTLTISTEGMGMSFERAAP